MRLKSLLSIVLIAFSVSAGAATKDTLNIAVGAEFENLHPLITQQAATKYMLYLAWRPTVILSLDYKWEPLLIKQIPSLKNKLAKKNGTGLDATIEIIEKAQWGDGTPVTCKDIAFAWQVGLNKNVSNGNREPYENISDIVIDSKNAKKCVVKFKKNKFDFYQNFPEPIPVHLEQAVYDKFKDQPEGYDKNSLYTKDPTNPGLYNGPYVVAEVKLGSHVIFTANPKFLGKAPAVKRVVMKLLPNNNTHVANLRSGNVDMISPAGGLSLDQAVAFEKNVKNENLPFKVDFEDGVVYAHIDLNMANPILADLKVRKALAHGFDKKEMIKALLEGRAQEAIHFLPKNDPWYTADVPVYNYNRKEAQKLLDEAGWKPGTDGIRVKDGKRLSLMIGAAAGAKLNDTIETFLQAQFKAIGVELVIKNEPARVFFGTTLRQRKFDMALFSWVSVPENTPRSLLHSGAIPSEANAWTGQNSNGWINAEVDKLIDQLESELDAKKRAAIGKKILIHYAKDVPTIPLYFRQNNVVVPKEMKGYRLSGHLFYETLFAENWVL